MAILGADHLWLDLPDAIYRGELYASEEALFGEVGNVRPGGRSLARVAAGSSSADAQAHRLCAARGRRARRPRLVRQAALELAAEGTDRSALRRRPVLPADGATAAAMPRYRSQHVAYAPRGASPRTSMRRKIEAVLAYASQARWIFREYGEPAECLRSLAGLPSRAAGLVAEASGCR